LTVLLLREGRGWKRGKLRGAEEKEGEEEGRPWEGRCYAPPMDNS